MFELNILRSLFNKDNYRQYRNFINEEKFSKDLLPFLKVLDDWHLNHNEDVNVDDYYNMFFAKVPFREDFYKPTFEALVSRQPRESTITLLDSFYQQQLMEEISVTAQDVSEGRKDKGALDTLYSKLSTVSNPTNLPILDISADNLLDGGSTAPGLRWRLQTLNRMLGSIRKGDFGFIFARPEVGKTAFLASEVSFMLGQLKEKDGPIIWFNNEEGGKKVIRRVVQAFFGITGTQLNDDIKNLTKRFLEAHNNRFVFVDNAELDRYTIEKYMERYKPSLIVIDQLDKIGGFKADREDLILGAIYIWARSLAKKYCPTLGVCQADGSAEGVDYLHMGHVANSKTSKSAEADFIVGIGAKNEPGYQFYRYLSIIKNKLVGDIDTEVNLRHGRRPVSINPQIMRYEDIPD